MDAPFNSGKCTPVISNIYKYGIIDLIGCERTLLLFIAFNFQFTYIKRSYDADCSP